jgi:hypothetical protein
MTRVSHWLIAVALGAGLLGTSWILARAERGEKETKTGVTERKVTIDELPKPVRRTLLQQAGKNKVKEIEEVTEGGRTIYEAEWVAEGREVEIAVAANGNLLGKEMEEADEEKVQEAEKREEEEGEEEEEAEAGRRGKETERQVTGAEVPKAALAALKKLAAGAQITEFAEEVEYGHTFYEGSWKAPSGANMDVLVTPTGDLVEIEERIAAEEVPAAVLAAARKAAGKNTPLAFEKKTMLLYEVKFAKKDRRHELLLTPDGRRAQEEVEKGKRGRDEDEDEDEDDDRD